MPVVAAIAELISLAISLLSSAQAASAVIAKAHAENRELSDAEMAQLDASLAASRKAAHDALGVPDATVHVKTP